MKKTKTQDRGWINYKDWVPDAEVPILLNVKISFNGQDELVMVRKAKICGLTYQIRYTDCTHPAQQRVCFEDWIKGWKFQREEDMLNLRMHKNTWSRPIEADCVLRQIQVSKLDELSHFFNSAKQRMTYKMNRLFRNFWKS